MKKGVLAAETWSQNTSGCPVIATIKQEKLKPSEGTGEMRRNRRFLA
jgi:hypothetical protein